MNAVTADFAKRQHHQLADESRVLNLEAQLDMLREARRDATYAYERDEIEARRAQLRRELIAARRALHPKPVSINFFRRFLAAIFTF